MILISSMKYTFIYDIYGNVNFFILFTHQKFATTFYSICNISNSPKNEREMLTKPRKRF